VSLPEKISFRPGKLAGALARWCKANEQTPSEAIRVALAAMLNVEPPAMDGNLKSLRRVNLERKKRKADSG